MPWLDYLILGKKIARTRKFYQQTLLIIKPATMMGITKTTIPINIEGQGNEL